MSDKIFILGLGASKSGTTWIQTYLNRAKDVDMGRLGEYQVWDALHVPENRKYLMPAPSSWDRFRASLAARLGRPIKASVFRYDLQQDPARYFDYFERQLARPEIRITGDITPGYAGLPPEVLRRIDETFAARGITVKPIFVMRDPIERAWSAIRMRRRKGRAEYKMKDEQTFEAKFKEAVRGGFGPSYESTLRNIDAVFGESRAYLGLYETMFTPQEVQRLSDFAKVPTDPGAGTKRVNDSGERTGLRADLARAVFPEFAQDYAYCLARFPEARKVWPHAHLAR